MTTGKTFSACVVGLTLVAILLAVYPVQAASRDSADTSCTVASTEATGGITGVEADPVLRGAETTQAPTGADAEAGTESFSAAGVARAFSEDHPYVAAWGGWKPYDSTGAAGGRLLYSTSAGATIRVLFRGTGITWTGPVGPGYGEADVYLDHVSQGRVSQYAAAFGTFRDVWSADGLEEGVHILVIRSRGSREPVSAGNTVLVDGFQVSGEAQQPEIVRGDVYEELETLIGRSGTWSSYASTSATGGRLVYSVKRGSRIVVSFTGDTFAWLGPRGPNYGQARVTVDGRSYGVVSQYAPVFSAMRAVWSVSGLGTGTHTAVIEVLGTREPASSGIGILFDGVELWSPSGATFLEGFVRCEQSDPHLGFDGPWKSYATSGASGGNLVYATAAGLELRVGFHGTGLSWIGPKGPGYGQARIYVDGVFRGTVSQYAALQEATDVVWSITGLPEGRHTVGIEVLGTKQPASTGTAILVDALDVRSSLRAPSIAEPLRWEQDHRNVSYDGPWKVYATTSASGGSATYSATTGSSMAFVFEGTAFSLIGPRGPAYGQSYVYVDGAYRGRLDQYASTFRPGLALWTMSDLSDGRHQVIVKVAGTKYAASAGVTVLFDSIELHRVDRAPKLLRPLRFNYPWRRYIVVDKSDRRLYHVIGGVIVANYPVAIGKPSSPTPNAIWRIDSKYCTSPTGVYGPRKMRLYRQQGSRFVYTAYNIHGTNNPSSIGTMASAGCIRLYNHDVLNLFPTVPLGTIVVTRD